MIKIGKKIKEFRTYNNLTQEELADRCELTKSYISQLEHDKTSPSLETLEILLEVLGTNFKEFFDDGEKKKIIFTEEDQSIKEENGYSINWLVPTSQKLEMEPIIVEIEPHSQTFLDNPHEGEEFGYVLEGAVELIYDGMHQIVKKGQSFYYEADEVHYLKNKTNKKVKVLWVSCPPTF